MKDFTLKTLKSLYFINSLGFKLNLTVIIQNDFNFQLNISKISGIFQAFHHANICVIAHLLFAHREIFGPDHVQIERLLYFNFKQN